MVNDNVVTRFSDVSFEYARNKPLLKEVNFSVRAGNRIALMGQNGAGKSTLFKLITREIAPQEGAVHLTPPNASIAIARQVMPGNLADLSVRDYFATAFKEQKYNLDKLIKDIFAVVNIDLPLDKKVNKFSGGQQARLLLAHALIQNPYILLLDEPTNNLDQAGINHLTEFLVMYEKTVLVISHDADFLNIFTDGVLYLDVFTKKVDQYTGNYFDVIKEIKNRIERENLQNVRAQTQIKKKLAQAEVFAHKGGKLRSVAKKMREAAEKAEGDIVSVRRDDKTIRDFTIPTQDYGTFFDGKVMEFSSISAIRPHGVVTKKVEMVLRRNFHLLISGPNGIGKSTLLEKIAAGKGEGFTIAKDTKIGYYKQDFSNFDMEQIAFEALSEVMQKFDEHTLRATAAGFLLDGKLLGQPIGALSEGQKGLLSFCRLGLMKPGLLILDEPTNHINFRHLPVIAKALDAYEGVSLIVSHIPEFVSQIRIDETIDLSAL